MQIVHKLDAHYPRGNFSLITRSKLACFKFKRRYMNLSDRLSYEL